MFGGFAVGPGDKVLDPGVQGVGFQGAGVAPTEREVVVSGAEEEFPSGDDALKDPDGADDRVDRDPGDLAFFVGRDVVPVGVGDVLVVAAADQVPRRSTVPAGFWVGAAPGPQALDCGRMPVRLRQMTALAVTLLPAGKLPAAAWLAIVYAAVVVLNGAGQFFDPARTAVIAALEPGVAGRTRAAGLAEATLSAATMIGPLIAVPLTLAAGIRAALAVDAVTFMVSWLSVRGLPSSRPAQRGRGSVGVPCRAALLCRLAPAHGAAERHCHLPARCGRGHRAQRDRGDRGPARDRSRLRRGRGAGRRRVHCRGPCCGPLLAAYGTAIGLLNTSAAPYLMGSVPGEYLGRTMTIFQPVNQAAGAVSVLGCGWLAGTVLHGFHAAGIGPVSLLLLIGAVIIIITAVGVRAAAALPSSRAPAAWQPQERTT